MLLVPALGALTWYGKLDATGEPHQFAANLVMIVALGHALIGIRHGAVQRDGSLALMLRPQG